MAIKGKSKSRGAKGVTLGPKPAYVPVKTPLLRRSGLWVSLGTLLVVAVIGGITAGLIQERNDARAEDQVRGMAAAVNQYRGQIDPVLSTLGSQVPPAGFDAYPQLEGALTTLEDRRAGQNDLVGVVSTARDAASSARDAIGLFEGIEPSDLVGGKGLTREFVSYVIDAHDNLLEGLRLYREVALMTSMAVEAEEGPARDDLVARARGVLTVADEVFARGYSDYVQAQSLAEVFQPFTGSVPSATGATGATG